LRLDKFLKMNRIIKRRVIAKEAIEKGFIFKNGVQVKPSSEVRPGDTIAVKFSNRTLIAEVKEDYGVNITEEIRE